MTAEEHLDGQVGVAFCIVAAACAVLYGASAVGFIVWAVTHWN